MERMSTLCYIEREGKYLMLHRTIKENDVNPGKWIGVGGHFDSIFKVNDHGTEKFFALSLHPTNAGMRLSIRMLGVDDWAYDALRQ